LNPKYSSTSDPIMKRPTFTSFDIFICLLFERAHPSCYNNPKVKQCGSIHNHTREGMMAKICIVMDRRLKGKLSL
jgi:hypothetical protein